ncbi:MAG: hypothetical protein H3C64_11885, partial [Candidatus Kuenenia stuttgartiensis]|nr:hypothetical protein [Candidatus Kuenenia stuttgartiensis]
MDTKTTFQYWRMSSALLILVLLANSVGYSPVKAQSSLQFEGIIAYEDSTGNIILATGDGKRSPVTADADANQNPLERNQKPTYKIFGFSPNGAYLAFRRWSDDEGARLYIYNIANGNIIAKLNFSEISLYNPMQWHKDSDSIIAHQSVGEETGFENTTDDHEFYYRVYFSGERVLLFDTYSHHNRTNINFDLNTFFEFNENHSPGIGGILHNWVENTKYEVEITNYNVSGVWAHDGESFIYVDNEYGNILGFDLKTGATTKNIDIPYGMWALYDLLTQSSSNYFLLSPDSKHLLLSDDYAGLYDLSFETAEVESVYAWPVNNTENEIKALWSSSGNLVMVNTYSADDQRVLVVKKGNLPVRVATSAEPLFWLSKDSERLVYAQYNVGGDKINGDLMVYDHATGASVKIGDLPIFKDVDTSSGISYGYYQDSVDWTNGEVDLPEAPPLPGNPFENELCPYDPLFSDKQTLIHLLQDTSYLTFRVQPNPPFKLLDLNYDEKSAQELLDSLKRECSNYENTPREEKLEFDRKMSAFTRLTYTEYSLNEILTQVVFLSEKIGNTSSDLFVGLFSMLTMVARLGDWLKTRAPSQSKLIDGFKGKISIFLLGMLDKI